MSNEIETIVENSDNSKFNLNKLELNIGSIDSKITEISPMTLKTELLHFKDELLKDMNILKKNMFEKHSKMEFLYKNEFSKINEKLELNDKKISEVSSVVFVQERTEKQINELLSFKKRIDDYTITNDIKFSNLEKDTSDNLYRIDNILRDTILYPGIVGPSCRFKNFHDFLDFLLNEISNFNSYREKNGVDLSLFKTKISKAITDTKSKIENINKSNNLFTRKVVNQCEERLSNLLLKYDEQMNTQRLQFCKMNSDLEKQIENTLNEIKKVDNKLNLHYNNEYFPLRNRFNLIYAFVNKEPLSDNKLNNNNNTNTNTVKATKSAVDVKTKKKKRSSVVIKNADIMSNLNINGKNASKNSSDEEKEDNFEKKYISGKNQNTAKILINENNLNSEKNENIERNTNIEKNEREDIDNIEKDTNNEKKVDTEKSGNSKKNINSSLQKSVKEQILNNNANSNANNNIIIKNEIEKVKNELKQYFDKEIENLKNTILNQLKQLTKIKNTKTEKLKTEASDNNKYNETEIDQNCKDFINQIIRSGIFNLHMNPNSSKEKYHSVFNLPKTYIQPPESFIDIAYKNINGTNLSKKKIQKRYSMFISPEKINIMDVNKNTIKLRRRTITTVNNFLFGNKNKSRRENSHSSKVLSLFDENNPYTHGIKSKGLNGKKNNNSFSSIHESSSDSSDKIFSTEVKAKNMVTIENKIKTPIQLSPVPNNKIQQQNLTSEKANKINCIISDKNNKNFKPQIINKTTYMNFPKINNTKEDKILDLHPLYKSKRFCKYISPYIVAMTNNIQACFEKSEKKMQNKNLREQKKLLYHNSGNFSTLKNKYNKNNENSYYGIKHTSPGFANNMLKSIEDKELMEIIKEDLKKRQEKKITNVKLNKNNRFTLLKSSKEKSGFINLKTK